MTKPHGVPYDFIEREAGLRAQVERLTADLAEARDVLTKLADAAELDMQNNQKDDEDHPGGGWWSLRTDEAIREARSVLSRLAPPKEPT